MADALSLLRQYNVNKMEIVERDSQIIFGEFSWPKNVKTNYRMKRMEGSIKEYYTLECLLFILKNIQLKHPVYVRQAAAANIPAVRRPDRKELLAYLNGEISTSAFIDKSASLGIPAQVKRTRDNEVHGSVPKKPRIEETHEQNFHKQLTPWLQVKEEVTEVTVDDIKSISKAKSVEKIAAIKAKRLAKKRRGKKKKKYAKTLGVFGSDLRANCYYDGNQIYSSERQWRTRTTVSQSIGKIFSKKMDVLQGIGMCEEGRPGMPGPHPAVRPPLTALPAQQTQYNRYDQKRFIKQEQGMGMCEEGRPGVPGPQPVVLQPHTALPAQRAQYNRYDQERFIKQEEESVGFKIDTQATYHGMSMKSVAEGPSAPLAVRSRQNPGHQRPGPKSLPELAGAPGRCELPPRADPIIILPAGSSSLVTMLNVRDLLQHHRYVPVEQKKAEGAVRENEVVIQRRKGLEQATVAYRVVDAPGRLSAAEWARAVAVFVGGPAWQFKGWPWGGNPVLIFSNICAFHLKLEEEQLGANVSRWAVRVLSISSARPHLHRAALRAFWETLDKAAVESLRRRDLSLLTTLLFESLSY